MVQQGTEATSLWRRDVESFFAGCDSIVPTETCTACKGGGTAPHEYDSFETRRGFELRVHRHTAAIHCRIDAPIPSVL